MIKFTKKITEIDNSKKFVFCTSSYNQCQFVNKNLESIKDTIKYLNTLNIKLDRNTLYFSIFLRPTIALGLLSSLAFNLAAGTEKKRIPLACHSLCPDPKVG